jgi:hypothetical protein
MRVPCKWHYELQQAASLPQHQPLLACVCKAAVALAITDCLCADLVCVLCAGQAHLRTTTTLGVALVCSPERLCMCMLAYREATAFSQGQACFSMLAAAQRTHMQVLLVDSEAFRTLDC